MQLISNNQSSLEKFFKSRNAIIVLLTATSLLQSLHTTLVIKHLTFIKDDFWAWTHSFLLSLCVELYIVVFSIRGNGKLANLYLWFTVLINLGMSYVAHGLSFNFAFYSLITSVFPLSVYYTADELAKKQYEAKPANAGSEVRTKRKYVRRKK